MKQKEIQDLLNVLVGLPLCLQVSYRAADMRMFGFGKIKHTDNGKQIPEYSLHVLSSWRIEGPTEIVTGHRDLREPINEDDWDEDWDYEEGNLQDFRIAELMSHNLIVESVKIKKFGDLEIMLSGDYKIVTFLNCTRDYFWVFLQPNNTENVFFQMDQETAKQIL